MLAYASTRPNRGGKSSVSLKLLCCLPHGLATTGTTVVCALLADPQMLAKSTITPESESNVNLKVNENGEAEAQTITHDTTNERLFMIIDHDCGREAIWEATRPVYLGELKDELLVRRWQGLVRPARGACRLHGRCHDRRLSSSESESAAANLLAIKSSVHTAAMIHVLSALVLCACLYSPVLLQKLSLDLPSCGVRSAPVHNRDGVRMSARVAPAPAASGE